MTSKALQPLYGSTRTVPPSSAAAGVAPKTDSAAKRSVAEFTLRFMVNLRMERGLLGYALHRLGEHEEAPGSAVVHEPDQQGRDGPGQITTTRCVAVGRSEIGEMELLLQTQPPT